LKHPIRLLQVDAGKVGGMAVGAIGVGGMGVPVGIGVGATHAIRMAIENKIQNIRLNIFRITIPPFDLGIPQIIHLIIL